MACFPVSVHLVELAADSTELLWRGSTPELASSAGTAVAAVGSSSPKWATDREWAAAGSSCSELALLVVQSSCLALGFDLAFADSVGACPKGDTSAPGCRWMALGLNKLNK